MFDPLREVKVAPEETTSSQQRKSLLVAPVDNPREEKCSSREPDINRNHNLHHDEPDDSNNSANCNPSDELGTFKSNPSGELGTFKSNPSDELGIVKREVRATSDVVSFWNNLKRLRLGYPWNDVPNNPGIVISPFIETQPDLSLSVKLVITTDLSESPVTFTCNITTTIELVISQVLCTLFEDLSGIDVNKYILKVYGLQEYFGGDTILANYQYVNQCQKFARDVKLVLLEMTDDIRIFRRTREDDERFKEMTADVLLPGSVVSVFATISYNSVQVMVSTLKKEMNKILQCSNDIHSQGVIQAVKVICKLLGGTEPHTLKESLDDLVRYVDMAKNRGSDIDSNLKELVKKSSEKVYQSVHQVIQVYSQTFPVDFTPIFGTENRSKRTKLLNDCNDLFKLHIDQVSQPPMEWEGKYRKFYILVELWHGSRRLAMARTQPKYLELSGKLKLSVIDFDEEIVFDVHLNQLPRETCVFVSVIGKEFVDTGSSTAPGAQVPELVDRCLNISTLRIFDSEDFLVQGNLLLSMWPKDLFEDCHYSINGFNFDRSSPLVSMSLPNYSYRIQFPKIDPEEVPTSMKIDLNPRDKITRIDSETRKDINRIINSNPLQEMSKREEQLLWINRCVLYDNPKALPKVLKANPNWNHDNLSSIYYMINKWTDLDVIDAMQLLLPTYPDIFVREKAVGWIRNLGPDELCDFLPQLVQSLRFEQSIDSPISMFFMENALKHVRVAHQLYWLLKENVDDYTLGSKSRILLNALLNCCGDSIKSMLEKEEHLQNQLSIVSSRLKETKENARLRSLQDNLESVDSFLLSTKSGVSLPLSPSAIVNGLVVSNCSYFTSNTLPLKLAFKPVEVISSHNLSEAMAIFKEGDDLRQDMMTMQVIKIMDKIWLKAGLDLKVVTFGCTQTGDRKGFVEMVQESETLRKIQVEQGLTGSFNERSISEWLRKNNPMELDYQTAVDNFTSSCAAYAVATYVLGIGDRHNDNIMITTSGHLFHIDFGKFLGDAQMIGNIKRDRVPFVLTSDMAYVINGGSDTSKRFQHFVDLCCDAFNLIRTNSNLFLSLFSLMTSASIPGVTIDSVKYVHDALLPQLTEAEATSKFARKIQESLKAKSTQINFLFHTLGQLRFTGDHNDQKLLSFVSQTWTRHTDPRILSVSAHNYYKRKEPEKQYFHVIKVIRSFQPDPSYASRTFEEIREFHRKLCDLFPLVRFVPLPTTGPISRSNTQEVAEKRKRVIDVFLNQLMSTAEEIAHCELVYTFFHPILRDQEYQSGQQADYGSRPRIRASSVPNGQVKLSIVYKEGSLKIMVIHAKNLESKRSSVPDSYVKLKLTPDAMKETKRKTKIVKENRHPTFMEMIVYDYPLSVVKERVLNVAVWESDMVHGNTYIGAAMIPLGQLDLTNEIVSWFPFTG